MAKVYQGTLGLIGNTPLVEVVNIEKELGLKAKVLVKLEYFNPAGSVKDRVAKAMIEDAEEICQWLQGRYRLFIISNGVAKTQKKRLKAAGLDKYFEQIFVSEEVLSLIHIWRMPEKIHWLLWETVSMTHLF